MAVESKTDSVGAANLLKVILDGLDEGAIQPLVRVSMVGQPMDIHHHVPSDTWEKWCASFAKEETSANKALTGLLLTLPTGWILLAEGAHSTITAFMRAVASQKDRLYQKVKMIHHAEDVPARAFSAWGARTVAAAQNNYAEVDGGLLADVLGETVIGMLKIGQGVGAMTSAELEKIDGWADHFPDIPSNERVGQVLELDEVPSLSEFMVTFDAPVSIEMQADRVWPPERAMVY